MRPQNKRKMIAGLASAAGAAVLALGSLTAGAVAAPNPGPGDGPQTANVPYVAWVGEHVRLVTCDKAITNFTSGEISQFVNYQVEDWSGYQFQPPTPDGDSGSSLGEIFDPGPAAFFRSSEPAHQIGGEEPEGCVATDYKSLNPGLSRIRVDVRNESTHEIVFSHQFLVIWLTTNTPKLAEVGTASNVNADGTPGDTTIQSQANPGALANFLGDQAGDGKFTPSPFPGTPITKGEDKGLIQIKVTGSFPVVKESPLSNILTSPSYTLPESWEELAKTLSSSSEEEEPPGTNPGLWDIHGTPGEGTTTNAGSGINDPLHDVFFRPAFGNFTSGATATVGPFDPQAANETLLSDGRINADDAPMPAMRIDVKLAGNAGGSDLGGVGQIAGASKAQVYSRDLTGNAMPEGNLYNPYYGAYIPATNRPVNEASGITGPSPGGDFPGFLNNPSEPLYTFWNSVRNRDFLSAESTGCLRRTDGQPSEYQTPEGYRSETFYTDERGEVYVLYTPGDGFYLNHIPVFAGAEGESEEGKIVKNENGGCDLKGLFEKTIGESSISATAVYPYEPVDYPAVKSTAPVVKTVRSLWEKEWFEFPKGKGSNEASTRIIVAKAQDIDGYPFVGEEVCFAAGPGSSIEPYSGTSNNLQDPNRLLGMGPEPYIKGSTVTDPADIHSDHLCVTTNSDGLATIELTNSTVSHPDLNVHYMTEQIFRDRLADFSTNPAGAKEAEEAAERKEAEEDAAAEKVIHEEEVKNKEAREASEEAAEDTREEAAAAEKAKLAEEVTNKEKTAEEAKTKEAAENKAREEAAAAEKKANEEAATAEKEKHEKEVAALVKTTSGGSSSPLLTPIPNTLPSSNTASGGVKAYTSKKKAHAAKHKAKKKGKKKKKK